MAAKFNSIDTPTLYRASDLTVIKILVLVSEPIILGVTKPTEQLEHIFAVAGTRVGEYHNSVALRNIIQMTSHFDHAPKGNPSVVNCSTVHMTTVEPLYKYTMGRRRSL